MYTKSNAGKIMTVCGPILPEELGPTLAHEHLVCDLSIYAAPSENPAEAKLFDKKVDMESLHFLRYNPCSMLENCRITNSEEDVEFLTRELKRFASVGGKALVDMTLDGFGRDVVSARRISENSGVHVIAGCGNYVKEFHPPYVSELSVDKLAEKYIDEVRNGIGDTGIRPGMIGEIGTSWEIDPDEIKVMRAAAITQMETGLPINIHAPCSNWQNMHRILDILEEAGAELDHVVLSHRCGSLSYPSLTVDEAVEHLASLAARGSYVEFDLCGGIYPHFTPDGVLWNHPDDRVRATALIKLCQRGYSKKLLLSHDACYRSVFSSYGGWALTHVMTDFKKILDYLHLPEEDYQSFIIHNPARMLTIR